MGENFEDYHNVETIEINENKSLVRIKSKDNTIAHITINDGGVPCLRIYKINSMNERVFVRWVPLQV